MFSEEPLEWDFYNEYYRNQLEFSNCNKNVKFVGEHYVNIKLRDKTIENEREHKITIKREIEDDDLITIGVCDWKKWEKSIYYDHINGSIYDNNNQIKKLNEKFKLNDSLVIKDTCVAKLNNNEHVYFVSMFKNGDEIFRSCYSDKYRKELYLLIGNKIEVEVDVKGKLLIKNQR